VPSRGDKRDVEATALDVDDDATGLFDSGGGKGELERELECTPFNAGFVAASGARGRFFRLLDDEACPFNAGVPDCFPPVFASVLRTPLLVLATGASAVTSGITPILLSVSIERESASDELYDSCGETVRGKELTPVLVI